MEQNKKHFKKIGECLFNMIFNVFYNSFFIWIAVNLFLMAFGIPCYLTFMQSISVCFLSVAIGVVFGIGGSSK